MLEKGPLGTTILPLKELYPSRVLVGVWMPRTLWVNLRRLLLQCLWGVWGESRSVGGAEERINSLLRFCGWNEGEKVGKWVSLSEGGGWEDLVFTRTIARNVQKTCTNAIIITTQCQCCWVSTNHDRTSSASTSPVFIGKCGIVYVLHHL